MIRLLLISILLGSVQAYAQGQQAGPNDIRLEIRLSDVVTKAQVLSLGTLGINNRGRGQRVVDLVIQNTSTNRLDNLYLHITVSSSAVGVIATADSDNQWSFSLLPGQVLIGNNNNFESGFPGIVGTITMTGELTPGGDRFIESLEGVTRLPDAVYTTVVSIYQGANRLSGGRLVATTVGNVGSEPIANVVDFNILTPGGPIGSGETIGVAQPTFRWEGPTNTVYRLLVVRDPGRNQTAETLISQALSTGAGGTLLENEMVDVIVQSNSYFYPSSGVKVLRPGTRYFWQVIAQIRSATGVEQRPSAIYEFLYSNPQAAAAAELQAAVAQLLAASDPETAAAFQALVEAGFSMDKLVVDGRELTGAQVRAYLEEFFEKARQGNVVLVKGN
jgi:hypothetical protein